MDLPTKMKYTFNRKFSLKEIELFNDSNGTRKAINEDTETPCVIFTDYVIMVPGIQYNDNDNNTLKLNLNSKSTYMWMETEVDGLSDINAVFDKSNVISKNEEQKFVVPESQVSLITLFFNMFKSSDIITVPYCMNLIEIRLIYHDEPPALYKKLMSEHKELPNITRFFKHVVFKKRYRNVIIYSLIKR